MKRYVHIAALLLSAACSPDYAITADNGSAAVRPHLPAFRRPNDGLALAPSATIDMAATDGDLDAGRLTHTFDINRAFDIFLAVRFDGVVPLNQTLRLDLYNADGGLLGNWTTPIQAKDVPFVLPIAGTDIARRQLRGSFALLASVARQEVAKASIEFFKGEDP